MFQGQSYFIIGGDEHAAMTVGHIFKSRLNHVKKIRYTDIRTAAMVKYSENAFLATKVTSLMNYIRCISLKVVKLLMRSFA